jgi:hypothetical protein
MSKFLLLFLTSCSTAVLVPQPQENASAPSITTPVVIADSGAAFKLSCDSSCNDNQKKGIPEIESALNKTISSQCFADYFTTPKRQLDNTNGLTPSQIVDKLRTPIDLTINYYYKRFTSALGYESAPDFSTVHINAAKTGYFTNCQLASLVGHEMSHAKGFTHNGNSFGPNQYTIPYQVNHAFEDAGCCK